MNRNESILDIWLRQLDQPSSSANVVDRSQLTRFIKNHDAAPSLLATILPTDRRDPLVAIAAFLAFTDHVARRSPSPDESIAGSQPTGSEDATPAPIPRPSPIERWKSLIAATETTTDSNTNHPVLEMLQPLRATGRINTALLEQAAEDARHRALNTHVNAWDILAANRQREAETSARLIFPFLATPTSDSALRPTSAIIGALLITRELRSLNRDLLTRGRLVLPAEFFPDDTFETRLIRSAKLGHGVDHDILRQSIHATQECTRRLWDLYEFGRPGIANLAPIGAAAVDAVGEYGQILLQTIEQWNCEIMLHEPTIGASRRFAWKYKFRKALKLAERQLVTNNPDND